MISRDSTEIKASKKMLYLSILCISLILLAVIISYTPLIRIYWINWLDLLILSNTVNLIIISLVLAIIYRIEVKFIQKKIDDFNNKLGGK